MERRIAITGMGIVSPIGIGVDPAWSAALAGTSGVGPITLFDSAGFGVSFAAECSDFSTDPWLSEKEARKLDRSLQFAVAAGDMAWHDAGLSSESLDLDRVGVFVGSGIGGMRNLEEGSLVVRQRGPRRVSPFMIPSILINLASGQLSIRFGTRGPNFSHVSACATANHSIGEAMRTIRHGYADVMLAGGAEAGISPLAVAGFARMQALSTRNDDPQAASRPFDAERDGFVIGEGAGVLVLEEWDHAQARGAQVYAELVGYGANSDAYHITAPLPDGSGARRCMELALADAHIAPQDVGYINAHGTSTPYNDKGETAAIRGAFGSHADNLVVSSTKSMTGHALGAAGGLEAVFSIQMLRTGMVPPTINYAHPDPQCDLDYCPNEARPFETEYALSNGLGFGGTNGCLIFKKVS